jgi:hypothetical protein
MIMELMDSGVGSKQYIWPQKRNLLRLWNKMNNMSEEI